MEEGCGAGEDLGVVGRGELGGGSDVGICVSGVWVSSWEFLGLAGV